MQAQEMVLINALARESRRSLVLDLEELQKGLEAEEEKRCQTMLLLLQELKERKYASYWFWGEDVDTLRAAPFLSSPSTSAAASSTPTSSHLLSFIAVFLISAVVPALHALVRCFLAGFTSLDLASSHLSPGLLSSDWF
ncbi:hypothetical protein BT69DRAFT_1338890 [Atractiella rhizophila]|nr:hypothetical protein BT69DRAFT_1338890 [Atractiella rhizophila]